MLISPKSNRKCSGLVALRGITSSGLDTVTSTEKTSALCYSNPFAIDPPCLLPVPPVVEMKRYLLQ
jgi:hypothetical protein